LSSVDLRRTTGFLVADIRGRVVGRVVGPVYGTSADVPDALTIRTGFIARRRHVIPAESIEQIDGTSRVVGLRFERGSLLRYSQAA
jgi:hypothetical protein